MNNLPDDWGAYYYTCDDCGQRAHKSEGCEQCGENESAIDTANEEIDAAMYGLIEALQAMSKRFEDLPIVSGTTHPTDKITDLIAAMENV